MSNEWKVERKDTGVVCTRAPDGAEMFEACLEKVTGGQNWLTSWVTIKGSVDPNRLKHAWKQVYTEVPALNSKVISIVEDADNPRFEATLLDTTEKLDVWADETFIVDETSTDAVEYLSPKYSFQKASLIWVVNSQQVAVHSDHALNDSYSCAAIIDRLLTVYNENEVSRPSLKELVSRLPMPIEHKLGCQPRDYQCFNDLFQSEFLKSELAKLGEMEKAGCLPNMRNMDDPSKGATGNIKRDCIEFTPDETARIISSVKARNVTVGELIWAACATALSRNPDNSGQSMTSLCSINLRRALPPSTTGDLRMGLHVFAWPIAIPITENFGQTIGFVHEYMQKYLPLFQKPTEPAEGRPIDDAFGMWKLATENFIHLVTNYLKPSFQQHVTSIGVMDGWLKTDYGSLTVKDFNAAVCELQPGVHNLWHTFDGKLNASFVYNDAFIEHSEMAKHVSAIKQTVSAFTADFVGHK